MQITAREFQACIDGVGLGGGTVQFWLPCAIPPDQDRSGRRRVPEAAVVHPERLACLPVGHSRAAKEGVQAGSEVFGPLPALGITGQRPEREHGEIAGGTT